MYATFIILLSLKCVIPERIEVCDQFASLRLVGDTQTDPFLASSRKIRGKICVAYV